ncbi:unnamed protein product [Caenorhabditis sp. 36 PRJEB53466]|nr:unnamed protein product [Caenorhabditis sp. 36 PRJEB53466]
MFPGDGEILLRSRLYIICGILVLIPNTICLLVFNSSKDFRQRFVFFTLLSVSDMINGISFIMSGTGRLDLLLTDKYHFETSSSECMTGYLWPVFLLFGGQLPATFHCLLTVERVLAVNRVSWYRSRWTWRHRLYLSSFGIFVCVFLNHTEKRKQMAILILSGINVVMVSVPNFVLVADEWHSANFDVLLVGVAYLLYGFQSCFNLPIFYFFRLEFRRRCHELLRFRRHGSNTIVSNEMSRQKLSRVNVSFVNTVM